MNNIPPEARELARQFQAEQAARNAAKAQEKSVIVARREEAGKTRREELKKVITTVEAERLAREAGLKVKTGGGKHPKYIEAENGEKFPLPGHPEDLSTGVSRGAQVFIQRNGIKKP